MDGDVCRLCSFTHVFSEFYVGPAQLKNVEKQPEKKQTRGQICPGRQVFKVTGSFHTVSVPEAKLVVG